MNMEVLMLKNISVEGLFGIYYYTVNFETDNGVVIIHGPNGSGKTTVLNMIQSFNQLDFKIFFEFPFTRIHFEYDDETVSICKEDNTALTVLSSEAKIFTLSVKDIFTSDRSNRNYMSRKIQQMGAIRLGPDKYEYEGKFFKAHELYNLLDCEYKEPIFPEWILKLKNKFSLQFIKTNRLNDVDNPEDLVVTTYQDKLKDWINLLESEYAIVSKGKDATFPNRIINVVKHENNKDVDESILLDKLSKLREKRDLLEERGILVSKTASTDIEETVSKSEIQGNNTLKQFLEVYIEDTEEKFHVFDSFLLKVKNFEELFENVFHNKRLKIDKLNGFKVEMNLDHLDNPDIPLEKLSSGEQHYLVMFYNLIFESKKNQMIIIDEPEISLHVSWQMSMIDKLINIAEMTNSVIVVATHSSAIMRNHYEISQEVGYQYA